MSVGVTGELKRESRETRLEVTTTVLVVALGQLLLGVVSLRNGWTLWGVRGWLWLIPILPELLLAVTVVAEGRGGDLDQSGERRKLGIALLALVAVVNAFALALLIIELFTGDVRTGGEMAIEAAVIWSTLILSFGMLFWELDGGGPRRRAMDPTGERDFLFSEMTAPKLVAPDWHPRLLDYAYLAFTTAIAWSPADVMPLSRSAKVLMAIETSLSALTILLVASRAVSLIG